VTIAAVGLSSAVAGVATATPAGALASARDRAARSPHKHGTTAPFPNTVDAPPTPAKVAFGSSLQGSPAPLLGNLEGDSEFWNAFLQAGAGIAPASHSPIVPTDGWLLGVAVHGYAVSGDMPGPGGSEPFRVGVEQVLPSGQLQVLDTSTPPYQLPGTSGNYYYWAGPPYTEFPIRLKRSEQVSFDTRGGTWAVFAAVPGSTTGDTVGTGQEQNKGVVWSGVPHAGVELLMQITEQPSVPVTRLEEAASAAANALELEQHALGAARSKAKASLKLAIKQLQGAEHAVLLAGEAKSEEAAEISHDTEVSLAHYLSVAVREDKSATPAGLTLIERRAHIQAAIDAKHQVLSDIRKAVSLAKQVP
jgi:hypothetical protein